MTQTWNWNPYAIALFDDQSTPEQELMPQIMNKSLHDTLAWITTQLGSPADSAFSNWKYGDLHVVEFGHPMGSELSFLNVPSGGPVGCDGGPYTVDPGGHHHKLIVKDVLYVESGASYRGIYECKKDWDTSLILVPPGESGLVTGTPILPSFDPHYKDTFSMWLDNEYTPCLFDYTIIRTYPKTTFRPIVNIHLFGSAAADGGSRQIA
jgi:acyl-homoserine lactone acylase PvdQ